MKGRLHLSPWLRRGIEAGVVGALLAVGTLAALHLSRPEPRLVIPNGVDGALIFAPAVMALGVFVVTYPTFLAATREEAILGVIAAFLVAADALMLISFVIGDQVIVHTLSRSLPLGVVAAALALPVAVVGLLVGQITAPFGFGRSAGLRSALGGAGFGLILVLVAGYTI
jgi:type IV secretory pathway VirB3-like protein